MNKVNPAFVLRNYLMEEAIRQAELGSFEKVNKLHKLSENPFDDVIDSTFVAKPP